MIEAFLGELVPASRANPYGIFNGSLPFKTDPWVELKKFARHGAPESWFVHRTSCVRREEGLRWGCLKSASKSPGVRAGLFVLWDYSSGTGRRDRLGVGIATGSIPPHDNNRNGEK